MRKIAFIPTNEAVPWGGSEYLWSAAAEKLVRRGVEVSVSVKDWGAPVKQIEHLRSLGCRIVTRRWPPPLAVRLGRKLGILPEHFRDHVRKVGAGTDLIVVSQGWFMDSLPWLEAARSLGYRYSVICEGVSEAWWPEDNRIDRLAKVWENACRAFFVSDSNLDLTRRMLVMPIANARVIRNPFNVSYDVSPTWPSDAGPQLALAFVSRLEPAGKGHDLLIELLSLPHWRARDIRVSLFGDGPNERSLRRMVENAKLDNIIQFGGHVEDVERIWSGHHALVLPSRGEGMPLVLVEAMLCGRPSIITDVGGVRELVRDGVNGFLAKAPTVKLLDEAMNRAWENRHRLREMGEQAAVDVREWVSADPVEDFVRELDAAVAC